MLRPRVPKVKTLIAFSALIMLLFCVYVAYQASKAYARAIEDGKARALLRLFGRESEALIPLAQLGAVA